jgi:hypothetical protein
MNKISISFLALLAIGTACKDREYNVADDASEAQGLLFNTTKFSPEQKKFYDACMSERGKNSFCKAYAVGGGFSTIYAGKLRLLEPKFLKGSNPELKEGATCEMQITYGQSDAFGILNGARLFLKLRIDGDKDNKWWSHPVAMLEPDRESEKRVGKNSLYYINYWVKHDNNFKFESFGVVASDVDAPWVAKGTPLFDCAFAETRRDPNIKPTLAPTATPAGR